MRRRSWWKWSLYPVLLTLTLLCGAVFAPAQSLSDDSDDGDQDAKPIPAASLSVVFAEDGTAQVNFFANGQASSEPEIKSMLESSLGCSLQTKAPFLHSIAQVYTGSCQPSLQRASTMRDLKIATAPLRQFALDHGIERLSLSLRLPDLEITETQPASSTQSLLVGRMPASSQHFSELTHQYFWQIGSDIPEHVPVRFGISANSVKRTEYVLLGVLLFPELLVFWMGRKALSSEAQDKAVVWFAYMRYLNWTLNLSLLGWWIAADSLHLLKLLQFFSAGTRFAPLWAYAVTPTIVKWLPPAVIWVVCLVLSHPVQENLRGLTWTRRELAMQGIHTFCASLLPLALFLTGLTTLLKGSVRVGMLWMVAVFIIASRARQTYLGMQPHALTTGDLRDRAFAMAQKLGVKLQQVYIIPSGKGQMANAFARKGNVISFTDFLCSG